MQNKYVVLARIADIISRKRAVPVPMNSTYESILKCAGLSCYWDKYCEKLMPYYYRTANGRTYENPNEQYDIFAGINGIFEELVSNSCNDDIILVLTEIAKRINVSWTIENEEIFEQLIRLYEIVGLSLSVKDEEIRVGAYTNSVSDRFKESGMLENWLSKVHAGVYECYEAAIDAYKDGHAGLCIESCRTCIVTLFEQYKGTEAFAKWIRGVYNFSEENGKTTIEDLNKALKKDLKKEDIADFFIENRNGAIKKTKAIYSIYSMLSDYGTHRGEDHEEKPSMDDALLSLRFTESILVWVSKVHTNQ